MNCEVFSLPELEVESYQVKEVLRCILHTVVFNRSLGLARPREVDSELFEITYAHCGDRGIEEKIEKKLEEFCRSLEAAGAESPRSLGGGRGSNSNSNSGSGLSIGGSGYRRAQLCLSFYERRAKQVWFSKQEEQVHWEKWRVNLLVVRRSLRESSFEAAEDRRQQLARLEQQLNETLVQILDNVNAKKDHIPPVVTSDVTSFPFHISFPSAAAEQSFGLDMVKRMLSASPPTMLS